MSETTHATAILSTLRGLRQSRRFLDQPVPAHAVEHLLEIARWTGSAKNTQPWEFIVVEDRATIEALSTMGMFAGFLDNAPLAIVLVLNGQSPRSEAYDEGRVSERVMLAADALGLGSGTGWFSTPENKAEVRALLGIPEDRDVWSAIGLGYPDESADHRSPRVGGGRKPLAEIVSYGRYGQRERD